jgi:hypothetical protein
MDHTLCFGHLPPLEHCLFSHGDSAAIAEMANFDILLYRDDSFVSRSIQQLQQLRVGCNAFSHVGLLLRGDFIKKYMHVLTLQDQRRSPVIQCDVKEKEMYVFESTKSGMLNDGVDNLKGRTYFGVQIRPLLGQIRTPSLPERVVCWCPLKKEKRKQIRELDILFSILRYDGLSYNYHVGDLLATACPTFCGCCRWLRPADERQHMLCPELAVRCFQDLGIVPSSVPSEKILPVDLLGIRPHIFPCIISKMVQLY